MASLRSPYSSFRYPKGYSLVTMDSLRKQEDEVIRNLSKVYKNLLFVHATGEIRGEKARIKRFLLIISVEYGALQ